MWTHTILTYLQPDVNRGTLVDRMPLSGGSYILQYVTTVVNFAHSHKCNLDIGLPRNAITNNGQHPTSCSLVPTSASHLASLALQKMTTQSMLVSICESSPLRPLNCMLGDAMQWGWVYHLMKYLNMSITLTLI
jgi:hypothetical protein